MASSRFAERKGFLLVGAARPNLGATRESRTLHRTKSVLGSTNRREPTPPCGGNAPLAEPPRFTVRYDLFVFDLDGTLADTRVDIASSVNHALRRRGLPPLEVGEVTRYVGEGARVLMERVLTALGSAGDVDAALRDFLSHYSEHCTETTVLYPGVAETLERLRGEGKKLAVLTNKPLAPTRSIARALGIEPFLDRIEGGDSAPRRKPDPSGLLGIRESLRCEPSRTLLVGDSSVDIQTARAAGVAIALVRYGFGTVSPGEQPDYWLGAIGDLLGPVQKAARS